MKRDYAKNDKSIAIIVCYFGELPWYFRYFLHSCKFNPTIDFIFISDTTDLELLPANVNHIHKTLADINILSSRKLNFQTHIENGYKFCDFKPAYGFLFSDLIEGYDFWGQSDIDLIFGDIRNFMTDDVLDMNDYISMRHDFPTGCFSLFRNNTTMNTFFMRSKDYQKAFSESRHFCFDECNNVHELMTQGKSIFEVGTEIESFMHIVKGAEAKNEIKAHFDFILIEGTTGKIKFDRGKLTYKSTFEVILYHLIAFKRIYNPLHAPNKIPDRYRISPTCIYH